MYKAPFAERIDLHKYAAAANSWDQAKDALKKYWELKSKNDELNTRHSLIIAFYVLYSRPFKERSKFRLSEDIVPPEHLFTHKGIVTLRDKMFAHSDSDFLSHQGDPMNRVVLAVEKVGIRFGNRFLEPRLAFSGHLELVEALIEKACYQRGKIWNRWRRHLRLSDGSRWAINVSEQDDEVLKRERK